MAPFVARTNILGVGVSQLTMPLAVKTIAEWIQQRHRGYVCVSNVHIITECQRDPVLRRIHNQADLVTPDGMPLVWVSHWMGQKQVRRVYGPDLMLAVCEAGVAQGFRHYFYGGAEGVAQILIAHLTERFPGLQVAGYDCPPFRTLSEAEEEAAIAQMNACQADIIWVGLGAPKQEHWMANHRSQLDAPVLIGVGAAFDFHAGIKKQAPGWLQRNGLEWLFRLLTEPGRLWRRYLINNPWFLWMIFLQMSGLKHYNVENQEKSPD